MDGGRSRLDKAAWHEMRPPETPHPALPNPLWRCVKGWPQAKARNAHTNRRVQPRMETVPFCQRDSGGVVPGIRTPMSTHSSAVVCAGADATLSPAAPALLSIEDNRKVLDC